MERNKYRAVVNDLHSFELNSNDLETLDLIQRTDSEYHLIENNKNYNVKIIDVDTNKKCVWLEVNEKVMTVQLTDMYDRLIEKMGLTVGVNKKVNAIKAPMPGLVLEVDVALGQEVAKGDSLLILEAMKMENILKAPHDATIKEIHINKGETVEKGQLLISFE